MSDLGSETRPAGITVKEIRGSSDSAESALVTMILTFGIVLVKQITLETYIFRKGHVTFLTLGFHILFRITHLTHDPFHFETIDLVRQFRRSHDHAGTALRLVVTQPAPIRFVTTRCHEFAFSFVVFAS